MALSVRPVCALSVPGERAAADVQTVGLHGDDGTGEPSTHTPACTARFQLPLMWSVERMQTSKLKVVVMTFFCETVKTEPI